MGKMNPCCIWFAGSVCLQYKRVRELCRDTGLYKSGLYFEVVFRFHIQAQYEHYPVFLTWDYEAANKTFTRIIHRCQLKPAQWNIINLNSKCAPGSTAIVIAACVLNFHRAVGLLVIFLLTVFFLVWDWLMERYGDRMWEELYPIRDLLSRCWFRMRWWEWDAAQMLFVHKWVSVIDDSFFSPLSLRFLFLLERRKCTDIFNAQILKSYPYVTLFITYNVQRLYTFQKPHIWHSWNLLIVQFD